MSDLLANFIYDHIHNERYIFSPNRVIKDCYSKHLIKFIQTCLIILVSIFFFPYISLLQKNDLDLIFNFLSEKTRTLNSFYHLKNEIEINISTTKIPKMMVDGCR